MLAYVESFLSQSLSLKQHLIELVLQVGPSRPWRQTFKYNFLLTYRIGLIFRDFLMKFGKLYFFISVNCCWRHLLLTKVILVKLKILSILKQWSKQFNFWNIFSQSKIIISLLELLLSHLFLCILGTHFIYFSRF